MLLCHSAADIKSVSRQHTPHRWTGTGSLTLNQSQTFPPSKATTINFNSWFTDVTAVEANVFNNGIWRKIENKMCNFFVCFTISMLTFSTSLHHPGPNETSSMLTKYTGLWHMPHCRTANGKRKITRMEAYVNLFAASENSNTMHNSSDTLLGLWACVCANVTFA